MAKTPGKITRTLHLKFTAPSADPKQLLAMAEAAKPFYEFFGGKGMRLLQNVDDKGRYVQVIEYETDADIETSRQKLASDARLQTYLQAWRAIGVGVEMEIFSDVASST